MTSSQHHLNSPESHSYKVECQCTRGRRHVYWSLYHNSYCSWTYQVIGEEGWKQNTSRTHKPLQLNSQYGRETVKGEFLLSYRQRLAPEEIIPNSSILQCKSTHVIPYIANRLRWKSFVGFTDQLITTKLKIACAIDFGYTRLLSNSECFPAKQTFSLQPQNFPTSNDL